jgi:hypothetical protein
LGLRARPSRTGHDSEKIIPEKSRNYFKAREILRKFPKILGNFPEIDWDMNNPNKVFGAQEKNFRAF